MRELSVRDRKITRVPHVRLAGALCRFYEALKSFFKHGIVLALFFCQSPNATNKVTNQQRTHTKLQSAPSRHKMRASPSTYHSLFAPLVSIIKTHTRRKIQGNIDEDRKKLTKKNPHVSMSGLLEERGTEEDQSTRGSFRFVSFVSKQK